MAKLPSAEELWKRWNMTYDEDPVLCMKEYGRLVLEAAAEECDDVSFSSGTAEYLAKEIRKLKEEL